MDTLKVPTRTRKQGKSKVSDFFMEYELSTFNDISSSVTSSILAS